MRGTLTARERAPLVTDAIPPALRRRSGGNPRRVLALCLVGTIVAALFASYDTPGWAERLGDSWLDHRLRDLAGDWDAAMQRLGLGAPHAALREAMRRALDWQWGGDNR